MTCDQPLVTPESQDTEHHPELSFCRGLSDCFACLEFQAGGWCRPRVPYILSPTFYLEAFLPGQPPGTLGYRSYQPADGVSSTTPETENLIAPGFYSTVAPFPANVFEV